MWVGKCLIELIPHFLYFYFITQRQSNLTSICQPYELQGPCTSQITQGVNRLNPVLKQFRISGYKDECTASITHLLDGWPLICQREYTSVACRAWECSSASGQNRRLQLAAGYSAHAISNRASMSFHRREKGLRNLVKTITKYLNSKSLFSCWHNLHLRCIVEAKKKKMSKPSHTRIHAQI